MTMRLHQIHRGGVLLVLSLLLMPLSACAQGSMKIPSMTSSKASDLENAPVNKQKPFNLESPVLTESALTVALQAGKIDKVRFFDAPGMKAFYTARNFEPVWIENAFYKNRKIEPMLSVLENSWKHGLNPNHYNLIEIRDLMENAKGAERYKLDLVVSDALVRYGRDMSAMRVDPKAIGQKSRYWRQPLRGIDVLDYVSTHDDYTSAMNNMAPRGKLYKTLQAELLKLYKTSGEATHPKVKITRALTPGTTDKTVLSIRRRMGFATDSKLSAHHFYDDELAAAVMAFQQSHGLKQDGIVGKQTAKIMNITHEQKLKQVLANMERLRWVTQNKPDRYIMVNVPSATLWAVENGDVKIEMPVVVGREERPTNIFSTQVDGIRFNPTWTVPPTIKKDDYLPKLRKNPYYLSDRGIELKKGGKTVDPGTIDWKNKTWAEVNAMRMVQGSGARNPLGRVRFLMNNPFNIYLHDTPNKSYFKKSDRALSSGCVRLERPVELADFVMKGKNGWTQEKRVEVLKAGKMRDIYVENKIPVYILYQTVWLGDNNQLVYGADLYGHDDRLIAALKAQDAIAAPAQEKPTETALNIQ